MKIYRVGPVLLLQVLFLTAFFQVAHADGKQQEEKAIPVFANIGDAQITQQEFDAAMEAAARRKFYHGNPSQGALAVLQREVGEKLVTNTLLLKEAQKRGLKPDEAAVHKVLEENDQRYRNNEVYKQNREQIVQSLTRQLQNESLLAQLEKQVRDVPQPDEKQMRDYYDANPDKFTQPEQVGLSYILLKVDPSSPQEVWKKTYEEAQVLVKDLRSGADFASIAREKSGDESSHQGGNMGYLHRGMMADAIQKAVDNLKPGEIADPIAVLEGIGIVRLDDRKQAMLNDFEASKDKIRSFWMKEKSDQAWDSLIARLKSETPISVDESRYLPLPEASGEGGQRHHH